MADMPELTPLEQAKADMKAAMQHLDMEAAKEAFERVDALSPKRLLMRVNESKENQTTDDYLFISTSKTGAFAITVEETPESVVEIRLSLFDLNDISKVRIVRAD